MTKRVLLVASLIYSGSLFAQDRLDGCGLGWEVTDQKTYTATTTRGTTNAFVPPTFGMTTGTMGCDKLDVGQKDKEAADFVATNFDALKTDLARGEGEYVEAMAAAFGCQSNSKNLGVVIQKNYDRVVAPASSAIDLFSNLRREAQVVCI